MIYWVLLSFRLNQHKETEGQSTNKVQFKQYVAAVDNDNNVNNDRLTQKPKDELWPGELGNKISHRSSLLSN